MLGLGYVYDNFTPHQRIHYEGKVWKIYCVVCTVGSIKSSEGAKSSYASNMNLESLITTIMTLGIQAKNV